MKKAFILIALFIPLFGMAQSYCLIGHSSDDQLERTNFHYGNNNELIAYELFNLVDPEFPIHLRDTLFYDSNGDCVKIKNYQLIDGVWTYTYYIDYTYDDNHNRLSRENYNSFDGGVNFDLGGRYEYTYENNRIVSFLLYFMDDEFSRGTYSYGDDGTLRIVTEMQNDLWGGGGWSNSAATYYQYNNLGQCFRIDYQVWDNNDWYLSTYRTFDFDEAGNTYISRICNQTGIVDRRTYFFDLDTPIEEVIMPVDPEGEFQWESFATRPLGYAWEAADVNGNLTYVCDYSFDYCEVTGINSLIADIQSMSIFPNPTTGIVRILQKDVQSVEVLDMNGRVVMQQDHNCSTIDLSSLSSGLYIMKAYDGQHWNVGKIQVK